MTTTRSDAAAWAGPDLVKLLTRSTGSRRSARPDPKCEPREAGQASPWLTVKEAADYASLSTDTIYTACEGAELRHARVSGRRTIRLRTEWIDAWLERHIRG